jgi:hypothetical protein
MSLQEAKSKYYENRERKPTPETAFMFMDPEYWSEIFRPPRLRYAKNDIHTDDLTMRSA